MASAITARPSKSPIAASPSPPDVLDMSVTEALAFFGNIPQIKRKLQTLYDVGLGYVRLGQPATTLRVTARRSA